MRGWRGGIGCRETEEDGCLGVVSQDGHLPSIDTEGGEGERGLRSHFDFFQLFASVDIEIVLFKEGNLES